jgi:rhodanese-related sulfurtransferase
MNQYALLAALVAAVVVFMIMQRAGKGSSAEAHKLLEAGALLVDVRSPGEFAGGHLAGAINVPVGEMGSRAKELAKKGKPIVVYCASGMRSGAAAAQLKGAGVQVLDLGAMSRW